MKISVALCTFNGERYLLDQLNSVANQLRLPEELVVCDDCSTDGTVPLIEEFSRQVGFKVAFSVNPQRLGIAANFERAMSLCSGDVILPCDQDDLWESDKLAVMEAYFRDRPDVHLAFSDLAVLSPDGEPTGRTQWQRLRFSRRLQGHVNAGRAFGLLLRFNVVNGTAMAFRASLRERALPIPSGFFHDEWIGLIAAATGRIGAIDRPLVRYRRHPRQVIGPAPTDLMDQYRQARANPGRTYVDRMVERTQRLHERLSAHGDALLDPGYLALVEEKLSHARARARMRDRALLRWPLAIHEALRGRYGRFGYGIKSFLQDLVL